jgi:phospholipid/cholesterol/gamma-HCH transport system permease protein
LERLIRSRDSSGAEAQAVGIPERMRGLLAEVGRVSREAQPLPSKQKTSFAGIESIGRATVNAGRDLVIFVEMLGELGDALLRVLRDPRRLRPISVIYQLDRVGLQAIPIIFLITFLIGGIISQQGIFHFRKFGAGDYAVDLVGILVLREIGVLIVAIMVAGRSGSSYTAELGSMKMREEIDALYTMGLDPVEVLLLPRVIALVCALPALTFFGSISALFGGCLVEWFYGGMSPAIYIARLRDAVSVTHFEVGIIKAPFMALVIGIVACSEGLRVKGSAESLGLQTTTSVVKSIFLVVVLDGFFAMFFAGIGM